MDDWLSYNPAGQYIQETIEYGRKGFYTFLPDPLTKVKIKMDEELTGLLCTANRMLGQLQGMSTFLPNVTALESVLMYKEAMLSCQIDGVKVPVYDILDTSRKLDNNISIIKNYISALHLGLGRVKGAAYKNTLLCEVHNALTIVGSSDSYGEFRKTRIIPGRAMIITNSGPMYYPTAPEHFPNALCDLEEFICRVDGLDAILKTALAYYQLETISPFISGNGWLARILTYLLLTDKKILPSPFICLSHYLSINKMDYKDRMEMLRDRSDYEQWVKFFVKSIIFAANDSLEGIKNWLRLRESNLQKIEAGGKVVRAIKPFYETIERFPIFDINTVAKEAGISYNTGATALKILSDLHIVKQTNQMTRNRNFAYIDFLKCFFSEDMLHIPQERM